MRGPLLPQAVPRFASRRQQFDQAALEAYAPLQQRFSQQLQALDLAVDTIPRMRVHADAVNFADDIVADGPVPLGRVISAGVDPQGRPTRARIVLFRMPIEQRSSDAAERQHLLEAILIQLVAFYLNIEPEMIQPNFERFS